MVCGVCVRSTPATSAQNPPDDERLLTAFANMPKRRCPDEQLDPIAAAALLFVVANRGTLVIFGHSKSLLESVPSFGILMHSLARAWVALFVATLFCLHVGGGPHAGVAAERATALPPRYAEFDSPRHDSLNITPPAGRLYTLLTH